MRLENARSMTVDAGRSRVERATNRLDALSPLRVLERGYALVYGPDGKLLRSSSRVEQGSKIVAQLARGRLRATVDTKE
jgi:exodeoxyribonuclease VII large subunit